eukprot:scaffold8556_cov286-Pinguiococcus_pyrenoidosus.AAC.9
MKRGHRQPWLRRPPSIWSWKKLSSVTGLIGLRESGPKRLFCARVRQEHDPWQKCSCHAVVEHSTLRESATTSAIAA